MLTSWSKDANSELFEAHFLAWRDVLERLAQVPRCLCRQSAFFGFTLRICLAPDVPACVITVGRQKKKGRKGRKKDRQITQHYNDRLKHGQTNTTNIAYQKGPLG